MKAKDFKIGMNVVLSSLDDAQIYQVKSVLSNNAVMLTYARADGVEVKTMPAHPSMIFEPTSKQLENLVSNKKIISGSAMLFNNDEGDWSEAFEPSDYDNIDHLDNAKISWSVDAAHISLARQIMQENSGIKSMAFACESLDIMTNDKEETAVFYLLEVSNFNNNLQAHLKFTDQEDNGHSFNITNEVSYILNPEMFVVAMQNPYPVVLEGQYGLEWRTYADENDPNCTDCTIDRSEWFKTIGERDAAKIGYSAGFDSGVDVDFDEHNFSESELSVYKNFYEIGVSAYARAQDEAESSPLKALTAEVERLSKINLRAQDEAESSPAPSM